eukprot:TRINITY_DN2735_c0_g1_i1.p2 TRINITY_DN2735_c0_g1~~TRINITY_DN2735_c0_g1_i1.p2  ORF type:complete len:224 (+),score=74.11 TRINITY_DN2735_c0_g1_i1:210-881(+)
MRRIIKTAKKMVEGRVEGAQEFIKKQIEKLKVWIQKLGKPDAQGIYCVEYGVLFREQNNIDALSGVLKTARKVGVVAYEAEHLLQGRDDHAVIRLVHPDDKQYEIVVSEKGDKGQEPEKDPFAIDAKTHAIVPCYRCKVDVMPSDRVGVAGKVLHRKCFECWLPECTFQLTPSRYASIEVDGQLHFYCVPHYRQMFISHGDYEKGFQEKEKAGAVVGAEPEKK